MKLVLIEWLDSRAGSGWLTKEQLDGASDPMVCKSVGWLFSKNKISTVIVPHCASLKSTDDLQMGRGELSIPTRSILKTTILR
jgi:hypothetical protein